MTYAEELEGAEDVEAVRKHLWRYRWQRLHHAQAETAVVLQRLRRQRMGENDAWQAGNASDDEGRGSRP